MNIRTIDEQFSVTAQISPAQVQAIADAGFKSVICARPDNEDPGQPSFAEVALEAQNCGLQIVHIPVSGAPSEGQVAQFREAFATLARPVLGYCRSGTRAGNLYAMLGQ